MATIENAGRADDAPGYADEDPLEGADFTAEMSDGEAEADRVDGSTDGRSDGA